MNRSIAIALAIAAASTAASAHTGLAGDITVEADAFVSYRLPAEVRTELVAYKKSGINPWARSYNPLLYFKSQRTHAEVKGDYLAAREEVAALNGEDSGSMYLVESRAGAAQPVRLARRGASMP